MADVTSAYEQTFYSKSVFKAEIVKCLKSFKITLQQDVVANCDISDLVLSVEGKTSDTRTQSYQIV